MNNLVVKSVRYKEASEITSLWTGSRQGLGAGERGWSSGLTPRHYTGDDTNMLSGIRHRLPHGPCSGEPPIRARSVTFVVFLIREVDRHALMKPAEKRRWGFVAWVGNHDRGPLFEGLPIPGHRTAEQSELVLVVAIAPLRESPLEAIEPTF